MPIPKPNPPALPALKTYSILFHPTALCHHFSTLPGFIMKAQNTKFFQSGLHSLYPLYHPRIVTFKIGIEFCFYGKYKNTSHGEKMIAHIAGCKASGRKVRRIAWSIN